MTFEEAAREHMTAVADGQVADLAALIERYCERGFYACRDRVVAKNVTETAKVEALGGKIDSILGRMEDLTR